MQSKGLYPSGSVTFLIVQGRGGRGFAGKCEVHIGTGVAIVDILLPLLLGVEIRRLH